MDFISQYDTSGPSGLDPKKKPLHFGSWPHAWYGSLNSPVPDVRISPLQ
jgi:hypothetical protein